MPGSNPIVRRAYRRTDSDDHGVPLLELVRESIDFPPPPTSVILKIHAISLNYRDANIVHGGNPWPVLPKGIPCSDAAGEVVAAGSDVKGLQKGDRVTPVLDQASITGREQARTWLAADADGVLADYFVVDEALVCRIPSHLGWDDASTLPCAGLTAWNALKGVGMGQSVLIQGTGGVSMMALKLARAAGCKVIISSSSDAKLQKIREQYQHPSVDTVNYADCSEWEKRVVELTNGNGVDLVLENGGTESLVRSLRCTKRGGIVSQVGYLGKQNTADLAEMIPTLIDRRINLRGINVGSKHDLEDLYEAVSATGMEFSDIIDARFSFDDAPNAIEYIWQGRQVGKVVVQVEHQAGN